MTEKDARFEDADEVPLRLRALDAQDLEVVSALIQDAVLPRKEMAWQKPARRFAMLLNRFRWEDAAAAARRERPVERVRSLLAVEDVVRVQSRGLDPQDEAPLCLLALRWTAGEEGAGVLTLSLAGGGEIRLEVEALEVLMQDVTRPYAAPSGRMPRHP